MKIIFLLAILSVYTNIYSQELNCKVQVNSQKVQATNKQIFETLERSISEFMNNRKWTNEVFESKEKIDCNIIIMIDQQISDNSFKATLQIQSRRPIYNTNLFSTTINIIDDNFDFTYTEFQSLDFNDYSYVSNLTSVLAFYSYFIIATDYDTFSLKGGTNYFKKAEQVALNVSSTEQSGWGWKSDEKKNKEKYRSYMIQTILNDAYSKYRECLYSYHRLGLDVMSADVSGGRMRIVNGIKLLEEVQKKEAKPKLIQMFFATKSDEIVNIFSEASPQEKTQIIDILKTLDPMNTEKYKKIQNK